MVVRVSEHYSTAAHIDTDEANAVAMSGTGLWNHSKTEGKWIGGFRFDRF